MDTPRAYAATLLLCAACSPALNHSLGNGQSCSADGQCRSNHCYQGDCVGCRDNGDCAADQVCGVGRILTSANGPTCISADAGCSSSPSACPPGGFTCVACPTGQQCNDSDGTCQGPGAPPVCGMWDPSGGYDAGTGPGPMDVGQACLSCAGCALGSECLCGGSGLIGGVRCQNAAAAIACFATGAVGQCQIFPGDCATNSQCSGATPLCNSGGTCVQCLKDADCPQTPGAQGCFSGTCGACCRTNADCGPDTPQCISGFCYPCQTDGGCQTDAGQDAGAPDAGPSDAGLDGGDGG